jgi:hypothetical protein
MPSLIISNFFGLFLDAYLFLRLGVQDLILSVLMWTVLLVFVYVHAPLARIGSELLFVPGLVFLALLGLLGLLASYCRTAASKMSITNLKKSGAINPIDSGAARVIDAPSDSQSVSDIGYVTKFVPAVATSPPSDNVRLLTGEPQTNQATLITSDDISELMRNKNNSPDSRGDLDGVLEPKEVEDDKKLTMEVAEFYRTAEFVVHNNEEISMSTSRNLANFESTINDLMREDDDEASCR